MKFSDILDSKVTILVIFAVIGLLGVDTLYRLFVKPPNGGTAEGSVSTAIGQARPWTPEEQQVLTRVLMPCRQPAEAGKIPEMVDCWLREAEKPQPGSQSGPKDTEILNGLLNRAGYKR